MLSSVRFLAILIIINVTVDHGATAFKILPQGIPQVYILHGNQRVSVGVVIEERFLLTVWTPLKDLNLKDKHLAIAPEPFGHSLGGFKIAVNLQRTTDYLYAPYKIKQLPNGASRATNDIAVMQLDSPILGDIATPVRYADINTVIEYGKTAHVSGVNDNGDPVGAYFPILDKETCNKIYKDRGGLLDGEFCAGGDGIYPDGASLCNVDLGTPLLYEGVVIGLASYIPDCNSRDNPPIFTELPRLSNYIDSKIKDSIGTSEWAKIVWREDNALSKGWTNLQYVLKDEPVCRYGSVRQKIMEGECSLGCKSRDYEYGQCGVIDECICFDGDKKEYPLWCVLYPYDVLCRNVNQSCLHSGCSI